MTKKKKKIKFKNRHRIPLKERLMFSHRVEIEMRRQMERDITRAFPDPIERAQYISSLIKELTNQIENNQKDGEQ